MLPILNYAATNESAEIVSRLKPLGSTPINGNRWEITVNANDWWKNHCFDFICEKMLRYGDGDNSDLLASIGFGTSTWIKNQIMTYAVEMAKKDERVGKDWIFENFSLIANLDSVPQQYPHIDLTLPLYQFAMIISDNTAGTITYKIHEEQRVRTPQQLVKFLNLNCSDTKIIDAFEKHSDCTSILDEFGGCLSTLQNGGYQVHTAKQNLAAGSVLSTPGSVLHAGPATNGFRAVLFYTGRPPNAEPYNSEVQWLDGLLLGELTLQLWEDITANDRKSLLYKLYEVVCRYPTLYRHFNDERRVQNVLKKLATKGLNHDTLIEMICTYQTLMDSTSRLCDAVDSDKYDEKNDEMKKKFIRKRKRGKLLPKAGLKKPEVSDTDKDDDQDDLSYCCSLSSSTESN